MSRIVYLIGAGASYGKRGNSKLNYADIRSGLPIVSEIPGRMNYIIEQLKTYQNIYPQGPLSSLTSIINDLYWLANNTISHASIDTFAKKLFLTAQKEDYFRLKKGLITFLNYEQMFNAPDSRYDSFLASILQTDTHSFPDDISVLSWNYDTQFEIAYHEYRQDIQSIRNLSEILKVYDKKREDKDAIDRTLQPVKGFSIIKLNGSIALEDDSFFDKTNVKKVESLCITYEKMTEENCPLSFAWEAPRGAFINRVEERIKDATYLVIIGYSFPFFNREIDRQLFKRMPNLKTIYIQDSKADTVKQSLRSALSPFHIANGLLNKIEPIPINETQFFLPPEL